LKVTTLPKGRSMTATLEDVEEALKWFNETLSRKLSVENFAETSGWCSHFNVLHNIGYKSICGEYV
jgi:hypothetical protein